MTDELPPGWAWSTIGEVCSRPQYGWTTSAARSGELKLLRTTDITSGKIDWTTVPFCAEEPRDPEQYVLADGDIVVSRAGSVGKSYLIREPERAAFASYLIRFRPAIDTEYVAYFLKSGAYWKQISEQTAGIAVPNINGTKLKDVTLPIAPLPEQARIVSKLDELFSRIDEGERALERVQKLVERYRQSVLKAAVTGELTLEWREKNKDQLESGEALLARILKARREAWEKAELDKMKAKGITPANDKWKQKYEEPVGPNTDGLPPLPDGWIWTSVAQMGSTFTGKTPPTSQDGLFGGHLPFLKPTDLDQGYDVRSCRQTLTDKGAGFCDILPTMSILVTCIGATIGKVGLARVQCATNQQINSLVVDQSVFDPRFVYWLFASPHGQQQVIGNSSSTTLPILNKSRFEALPMPVPSLAEQARIVDLIELRLDAASHLVEETDLEGRRASALRQVVLRSAFSGSLVHQDTSDEPASDLLERIAAERNQALAKPKRGRKPKTSEPA